MVSKALVVGAYQRKAEEIARQGVELTVLIPPAWGDRRGRQVAERQHATGYALKVVPVRLSGKFHLYHYPTLGRELARIRPQILHMDEEPYNLATWLGLRAARRLQIAPLFFTWQNLYRRYPPPFCWWEQANYRMARAALAGNEEAAAVLRRKGYKGPAAVVPQFGVDPTAFCPREPGQPAGFCIGYAGGLLPEKGVDLLIEACAGLRGAWRLHGVGEGQERAHLERLVAQSGVGAQVVLGRRYPSAQMPAYYRSLDVLVLPSRTTPTWKEQFGRVLIEAMACGVPVIGSDSGEIPRVVGAAGLIFAENDAAALRRQLQFLLDNPAERTRLAQAGRRRVLAHYTMTHVAQQTVAVYARML